MNLDLRPFMVLWGVLAVAVLVLLAWRKSVAKNEDDSLHLSVGNAAHQQTTIAQKLDQIDKWGKTLTVITVIYGLLLAAVYLYQGWMRASGAPEVGG